MDRDDELYRQFLSGKTSAYDELMILYGDSLTFYLYGYLHNWQDAEDLTVEAYARIMVKKPKIGDGNYKAYLFKTGRNLASRYHSKRTRVKEFSFEEYDSEPAGGVLVEDMLVKEEQKAALYVCLERIDPQLREALWLVYFERMSYAQAAQVMGVNTKRVDHLLTRGKKQMRMELEKEGVTDAYR